MADARYAGHRDPPDRAGARPESVPGNHLPQALRCARSSPGCRSRALRKQYAPVHDNRTVRLYRMRSMSIGTGSRKGYFKRRATMRRCTEAESETVRSSA